MASIRALGGRGMGDDIIISLLKVNDPFIIVDLLLLREGEEVQPLSQKSFVVVGGTTGLGLSATRALVAAGAHVVAVGRNAESAQSVSSELGNQVQTFTGDAVDPTTAVKAIELCLQTWNSFDGLYHVAGGSGRKMGDGPLHEVTDAGIDATLGLNLKSLILSNRAAIQTFLKRETGGSILNMASVLGYSPSPRFFSTHIYAAAKAGIIGFSQSIASFYAPQQIRVNVVAPGLVETPMAKRAAGDETILSFIKTKQPLGGGRIGHPQDLDAAVVYFLSDASHFCTGQVLAIDGGWSVSEGQIPT